MTTPFDLDATIDRLGLEPIPGEGTWFRPGPRVAGLSTIIALFADHPDGFSALHRLDCDEGWQYLDGDPIEVFTISPDGTGHLTRLDADHSQIVIPRGTWQGGRTTGTWTTIACWCSPAFEYDLFQLGDRSELVAAYPDHADAINTFTRSDES